MKNPTKAERAAMFDAANSPKPQEAPTESAGRVLWALLPLLDRERAMMLAKMPKARAGDAIADFTLQERLTICGALARHAASMSMVGMCMCVFVERAGSAAGFVH